MLVKPDFFAALRFAVRLRGRVAVYNHIMAKHVIHVSETEAASDFATLMARVRAGAEVVIEHDVRPVAILRPAEPLCGCSRNLFVSHVSMALL